MRIGLISLISAGSGGIPRYTTKLVEGLDSLSPEFPDLEFVVVAHPPALERLSLSRLEVYTPAPLRNAKARSGPRRIAAEQLAAASCRCDIVHFFDLTFPLLKPTKPFVATVHDAAPVHQLEGSPKLHKRLLQPTAARRAERLVAVSRFAKAEALEHYGAAPERTRVVHSGPGLSSSDSADAALSELPGSPSVRGDYFLYVGSLFEHKNLAFLVQAFEQVRADVALVLVGTRSYMSSGLLSALSRSSAAERIHFIDNPSDLELESLYRQARALVLPSRYEGFGFTALEAMSRGCPALVSDIPALREICGHGALLLAVSDEQAWAHAMTRLLDPSDGIRDDLRRRGLETAAGYSWAKTTREVVVLYRELAQGVEPTE